MSFVGKWFGFGKDSTFDEGVRSYEARDYTHALEKFREVLVTGHEPTTKDRAKSYLAGCLGKLGQAALIDRNFEEAKSFYTEATSVRPGFADLWYGLARSEFLLGNIPAAETATANALDLNPKYGAALALKGTILYHHKDYKQGFECIQEGVVYDARLDGDAWKEGQTHHNKGNNEKAFASFKEVVPGQTDVNELILKGDEAAKANKWLQAESHFRQAALLAPQYADIHCRRGQALLELGEITIATDCFDRSLGLNPDYADAHALLGVALRRKGEEDEAKKSFERAKAIDPNHPIANEELLYKRF